MSTNFFDYQETEDGLFEVFDSRDKLETPIYIFTSVDLALLKCDELNKEK